MKAKDILKQLPQGNLPSYPKDYLDLNFSRTVLGYLDVVINQRGRRVLLIHSVPCPCVEVNEENGGHSYPAPDCVSCGGYGMYFMSDSIHEFRALVSGTAINSSNTRGSAEVLSGSITVTVPSTALISPGDKLIFPDMQTPVPLLRKYKEIDGYISVPFAMVDMEDIVTKHSDSKSPVINMVRGKDYTLDIDNRKIVIPSESVVTDKMVVSMSVIIIPEYIIDNVLHSNRQVLSTPSDKTSKVLNLPKHCTALRSDLFFGTRAQLGDS